jgi:DNA-directed RNA polymerase specialized sigma24 family protein
MSGVPVDSLDRAQDAGGFLQLVVKEAMERLPAYYRRIVELRIEGYELEEIAAQVQRAKRTVERVLQQFREALKHLLDEAS